MELLACLALTIASHGRRMNGAGAWHRRAALRSSSTGEKAAERQQEEAFIQKQHFSLISRLFRRYVLEGIFKKAERPLEGSLS